MKQHTLAATLFAAFSTSARLLFASSVLMAALVVPSYADTITYSYSATNGMAGTFTFEDSVSFTLISALYTADGHSARENFYVSEYASYSGTLGEYSFTGLARLRVRDSIGPDFWSIYDVGHADFWYLNGPVSSAVVDGKSLTHFGVYEDYRPEVEPSNLFVPQTPNQDGRANYNKFSYLAQYSDGTEEFVQLQSLALVPETSSLLLLSCALLGVGLVWRRYQKVV